VISRNEKARNEIASGRSQRFVDIVFIINSPAVGGKNKDWFGNCEARSEESLSST
jgi:hypothetical protein